MFKGASVFRASWGGILCVATIILGCGSGIVATDRSTASPDTGTPLRQSPIQHVVIIMQENRTFDNLFNGYPGADTVQTGLDKEREIPLLPLDLADGQDVDHSHISWWKDWNNGRMNRFAHEGGKNPTLPYSYVPKNDTVPYWTLASQFTLGDRMFQSNTGPSFVAHQYMIAGQSGKASENPNERVWGCDAPETARVALIGPNGTDLPGVYPCFDYKTMADLLDAKNISWRYYAPGDKSDFFIISAFQAINHIRFGSDWNTNVISPETKVLTDIKKGELAQVTWIVPSFAHSDHPGSTNEGPDWVASITNAIGASKYWNSTAIFITWDDWGGWYDHVNPPRIDQMGLGFRVPLLVVSPYARRGYISHHVHESSGFLTYIEKLFNLPSLGVRDVLADDFSDCFDYTQPLLPYIQVYTRHTPEFLVREKASGPPDDD
jgi:phospholipase C